MATHLTLRWKHYKALHDCAQSLAKSTDRELVHRLDEAMSIARQASPQPAQKKGLVLLVSNDDDFIDAMQQALPYFAARIRVLRSASDATSKLTEHALALVVIDAQLPDKPGQDVLARLRQEPLHADVPALFRVSQPSGFAIAEAFALGATEVHDARHTDLGISNAIGQLLGYTAATPSDMDADTRAGLVGPEVIRATAERAASTFGTTGRAWSVIALRPEDPTGDLRTLAYALRPTLERAHGAVCRYDDHLVACLPSTDTDQARAILEGLARLNGHLHGGVAGGTHERCSEICMVAQRMMVLSSQTGELVVSEAKHASPLEERLLIVDDDPVVAALVRAAMANSGVETAVASTGSDAIAFAKRLRPTMIVLDIELPDTTGLELLKTFRGLAATHKTPVVLLTSHDDPSYLEFGLEHGAVDFISKPIDPRNLRARLLHHARKARL